MSEHAAVSEKILEIVCRGKHKRGGAACQITCGVQVTGIMRLLADALQVERERALEEIAIECCPACRDKAPFVWSDEDMRWCHPCGNSPLFFCQAPAGVRKRLAELRALASQGAPMATEPEQAHGAGLADRIIKADSRTGSTHMTDREEWGRLMAEQLAPRASGSEGET